MPKKRDIADRLTLDPMVEHLLCYGEFPPPDELSALRARGHSLNAAFELAHDDTALRALWESVRTALLSAWVTGFPGTRCWAWWRYDAPRGSFEGRPTPGAAPRQKIGGTGTPDPVGVDADMIAKTHGLLPCRDGDPSDPLLCESEPAYLKRIGALTPAERRCLHAGAFDPDVVVDDDDD